MMKQTQVKNMGLFDNKPNVSEKAMTLCIGSVNERRRAISTSPLICSAHTQNDPC